MSKNGAYVQRKVSHLFPPHTQRRIDIVITRNRFRTLVDVVIVDLTHINLVQQASMTTTHRATVATQNKKWPYTE